MSRSALQQGLYSSFCNAAAHKSRWLASSPAKRHTELLFLAYSPFWMVWALGVVVPFKLYEVLKPI